MNLPETAPKDRTILADIGMPWLVYATWNEPCKCYVYASIQCEMYNGEWNDFYFENENFGIEELKSWMEIPKGENNEQQRTRSTARRNKR